MSSSNSVTRYLQDWRAGNESALDQLTPLVYETLRRLARRQMQGEGAGHTLQTTALVHEAYEKLIGMDIDWQDRAHFYRIAARLMRRILVDHARGKRRDKRGGGADRVTLHDHSLQAEQPSLDVLALDEALTRLAEFDERKAQAVELHFFGGLTYAETARALEISEATVDRELRFAKAWLYKELSADPD